MAVDDRHHVGTGAVDLAVDEALAGELAAAAVGRVRVEVEHHDVALLHRARRAVARDQEAIGTLVVARADVAVTVEHALVREDVVRKDEVIDELRIGR